MLYVVKRDGREVEFNSDKIAQAIKGSAAEIGLILRESQILDTVQTVITYIESEYKGKYNGRTNTEFCRESSE